LGLQIYKILAQKKFFENSKKKGAPGKEETRGESRDGWERGDDGGEQTGEAFVKIA
jgi:hypothetical protein